MQINTQLITASQVTTNPNVKLDLVTIIDFNDATSIIYPLSDPSNTDFNAIDSNGSIYITSGIATAIDKIIADTKYKTYS